MAKSKALELLEEADIETPETPEYYDARLFEAIKAVAKSIEAAPVQDVPDYTRSLAVIASGIAGLAEIGDEVRALRAEIAKVAGAVGEIAAPDMSAVCASIDRMAASQRALTAAITAPRILTFDANGEPNGIRIERVN